MAIFTLTISDNGGVPVGSALTVPDYTEVSGHEVANTIVFKNTTAKTVLLTGGNNWSTFFSQNPLTIPASSSLSLTLVLNTAMVGSEQIGYALNYQGEVNTSGGDNPTMIVVTGGS